MFQETSWTFSSCRATKRNFRNCLRDSGLVLWFSLRVPEVPGSIPGCPLFPYSFKVMFQETSWIFSSCRVTKRNFRNCLRDSGLVLWFTLRVQEVPGFNSRLSPFPFQFQRYVSTDVMNLFELSSIKKKLSALFAGQWSSSMLHT